MMLFAIAILVLLWIAQTVFLLPYYRNTKINDVRFVASTIEEGLRVGSLSDNIVQVALRNNVCASVYNNQGEQVYFVDTLGVNCFINTQNHLDDLQFMNEYIEQAQVVSGTDFFFYLESNDQKREMMFYGKEVVADFTRYYVFVNAPIEPLDSTITILQDQFIYVTLAVFVLSSFVALFISNRIARPLRSMVSSAQRLAGGDVKVKFEPTGYKEITELAQTLNYATQEIAKMDELRKDLIANVSHDIKTPLTTIKAYAEMIKEISGKSEKKRNEHLDIILSEAHHLDVLVSDMLKLSQYDNPQLIIEPTMVHLKSMIDNIIGVFTGTVAAHKITIISEIDEAMMVVCDEVKMGQVIFNFVNNAITHVGDDRLVIIRAIPKKDKIRIEVIDHGQGIKSSDLAYIWDRYYRIDKNFTRNDTGSGLGLAIAKSICLAHHVDFGVVSIENQGSTFFVELPIEVSELEEKYVSNLD